MKKIRPAGRSRFGPRHRALPLWPVAAADWSSGRMREKEVRPMQGAFRFGDGEFVGYPTHPIPSSGICDLLIRRRPLVCGLHWFPPRDEVCLFVCLFVFWRYWLPHTGPSCFGEDHDSITFVFSHQIIGEDSAPLRELN